MANTLDMDDAPNFLSLPAGILQQICSSLMISTYDDDTFDRSYAGSQTVLALARTARGIHEYAINALWHTLPGYGFLLFALPRDAWAESVVEEPWRKRIRVTLLRPLVESDFVRMRRYARRVRRVLLPSDCSDFPPRTKQYLFTSSILAEFASHFSETTLLPNIQVLHASPVEEADIFYRALPVLFSPNLRSIYSKHCFGSKELKNEDGRIVHDLRQTLFLLHTIAPRCTYLAFDLESRPLVPEIRAVVSEGICLFKHLICVSTGAPISLQALAHLARLPSLHILNVDLERDLVKEDDLALLLEIPYKEFFRHLRQVQVAHEFHITPITTILQHISSPHVTGVLVYVPEFRTSYEEVKKCIEVIGHRTEWKKLTSVILCASRWFMPNSADAYTIDEDALSPLLMLPNLTHVEIDLGSHFSIDNGTCQLMALAWRSIEVLKLGPHRTQRTSQVTLEALVWFARLSPRLERLAMTLDADIKHLNPILLHCRPGLGLEQTALTALIVGKSPIDGPLQVAGFLSDLFPNLEDVDCEWDHEDTLDEADDFTEEVRARIMAESVYNIRWNDAVCTLLQQFALVRKQEREWARRNGIPLRSALKPLA